MSLESVGSFGMVPPQQARASKEEDARADDANKSPKTPIAAGGATGGGGAPGGQKYTEVMCSCGQGPCIVRTSRTEKNPGRDFYICPSKQQCGYFLWCDKKLGFDSPVKCNEQHAANSPIKELRGINSPAAKPQYGFNSPMKPDQRKVTVDSIPTCACGAGPCLILTMRDGDNAGRKYYGCHIIKGQGACNHFQWVDSPDKLSETNENCQNEDPKPMQILDISFVPESPLVSPKRMPERINAETISPMKKLVIHDESPGTVWLGKCAEEGHWVSECPKKYVAACYKCGELGHWQRDCAGLATRR